ncbi:MAG: FMN-binding protein [Oscillospiraceae bacterium]|nr:FMN-binding protein [Oscillospiraceae bacterium]
MKTESTVKFVLRLALTLLAITAVVAVALAGVNMITAPAIAELNAKNTQAAIETVLPGGGEEVTDFPAVDLVSKVYASETGYAVQVTPSGFDNTITMMVGVDKAGNVLGIDVISHTETAGLGAVADAGTPAGIAFREQFIGASGSVSVTKDGGQMDAITGATITSRAICVGVNAALDCVAQMG